MHRGRIEQHRSLSEQFENVALHFCISQKLFSLLCRVHMMLAESEEKGNLRRDMAGACPHSGLSETGTTAIVMFFPICLLGISRSLH